MKRLLLLTAIVLMSVAGFSQTTQEEYNYATKGLKAQYANGLDMKQGYTLTEYLKTETGANYGGKPILSAYHLLKKNDKICAIIFVYGVSLTDQSSVFYCIPSFNASSDIWEQYYKSISDSKIPAHLAQNFKITAYALSKALTEK